MAILTMANGAKFDTVSGSLVETSGKTANIYSPPAQTQAPATYAAPPPSYTPAYSPLTDGPAPAATPPPAAPPSNPNPPGGATPTRMTSAPPVNYEAPKIAGAPATAPAQAPTTTPSNAYYGKPRVTNLAEEQTKAQQLSDFLNTQTAGGKTLRSTIGAANWSKYVNAYVYGGYTLQDIANDLYSRATGGPGGIVHPEIPRDAWLKSRPDLTTAASGPGQNSAPGATPPPGGTTPQNTSQPPAQAQNGTIPPPPAGTPAGTTAETGTPTDYWQQEYLKLLQPSAEENTLEGQINEILSSYNQGITNTEGQAIPMQFISGQSAELEKRKNRLMEPYQTKLTLLQNRRKAAMDVAKAKMDIDKQARQSAVKMSAGETLVDPTTGSVVYAMPPKTAAEENKKYMDLPGTSDYKTGLKPEQIANIANLITNKPVNSWNAEDWKNYMYAVPAANSGKNTTTSFETANGRVYMITYDKTSGNVINKTDLGSAYKDSAGGSGSTGYSSTEKKRLEQAGLTNAPRQEQLDFLYGKEDSSSELIKALTAAGLMN